MISSKLLETHNADIIESHKKILDGSLNKILSGYHTPTANYSEFCLQIAKDLGFDVIENKMESLDELSIKIDQNLLANVQIRDEIASIIQKIIIDPLQEEQLNLLSKYFIKQSVCIAHVLYHEIIYVPPPSNIPIFQEEIELLKEYVPFFDSDLEITDDQKLIVKQIKENCNYPKLEECLQCKKPINEKCWNFIISDLAGVPVNIHYSEEVADIVGNKLGQNFYFIVKSKEINNFPNGGDKLLRQCISCFEIKDAIVFSLNPH